MFKQNLRDYALEALEKRTVEVKTGTAVQSVAPTRVTLAVGRGAEGAHARLGSRPARQRARSLARARARARRPDRGRARARRPRPGRSCSPWATSRAITDAKTGQVLPQLGSVALQSGEHAGKDDRAPARRQADEAVRLQGQGDDGGDRTRRRRRAVPRAGARSRVQGAGSPGARCTSRCCRRTRTAPRRSSTGPAPASRTSAWAGSRWTRARSRREDSVASADADVLVIFGITGDLAKVMTFRSLYRLERRGLLDCPIIGVAVDDWSVDQLVERARDSIVGTGEPLDETVFARFAGTALVRRRRLLAARRVREGRQGDRGEAAAGLLPRDPAVPVRARRQGAPRRRPDRERAGRGREAVRARPRVGPRARRRAAPVHRRVAALPDRPLPREDGLRRDPPAALRELDARAGLEPEPRRVPCRSRWPRTSASRTAATSTTRSARCATSSSTT